MTTKRIGYSRISTADQTVDSQKDALLKAGVDSIYSDIYTGTKASRPELDRLKDQSFNRSVAPVDSDIGDGARHGNSHGR